MVARLFTDKQEEDICRRYGAGESAIKIADDVGASYSTILNIVKRNKGKTRRSGIKPIDLVDERFGQLVVFKLSVRRTPSGGVYWWCRCDCGNKREVEASHLFHNKRKSRKSAYACIECVNKEKSKISKEKEEKNELTRREERLTERRKHLGIVPDEWFELPLTEQEAIEQNESNYFSGIPCPNGHIDLRGVNSRCRECGRIANAKRRESLVYRMQISARQKIYRKKPEIRKRDATTARERRRNDHIFRLRCNLGTALSKALKKKGTTKDSTTMKVVGCNLQTLVNHLESNFDKDMSWENYGVWHVDHIRPISTFDSSIHEQRAICWNWRNLFPLWGDENKSKQDNYSPLDETEWVELMLSLGYEGELFLKFEEGNSFD